MMTHREDDSSGVTYGYFGYFRGHEIHWEFVYRVNPGIGLTRVMCLNARSRYFQGSVLCVLSLWSFLDVESR